jgi:hypothetical protein
MCNIWINESIIKKEKLMCNINIVFPVLIHVPKFDRREYKVVWVVLLVGS